MCGTTGTNSINHGRGTQDGISLFDEYPDQTGQQCHLCMQYPGEYRVTSFSSSCLTVTLWPICRFRNSAQFAFHICARSDFHICLHPNHICARARRGGKRPETANVKMFQIRCSRSFPQMSQLLDQEEVNASIR